MDHSDDAKRWGSSVDKVASAGDSADRPGQLPRMADGGATDRTVVGAGPADSRGDGTVPDAHGRGGHDPAVSRAVGELRGGVDVLNGFVNGFRAKGRMSTKVQGLEGEAVQVIASVRTAFSGVIGALPVPAPVRRAAELSRVLKLSRKLGWQVWNVVSAADPLTAAQHLPSPAGVETFLKAASRVGVESRLIESARKAADGVDGLVDTHAGDRRSLERMIGTLGGKKREQSDEANRKLAFEANSFIWGSQLRVRLVLHVMQPASDTDRIDMALVNGMYGLRRMHPEARRLLFSTGVRDAVAAKSGDVAGGSAREALEVQEDGATGGVAALPLVKMFCSQPVPVIRPVGPRDGYVDYELGEWAMGDTGSLSLVTGEVFRNFASRYARPGDTHGNLAAHVNRATELLVHDLIVRDDLFGMLKPEARVYGELDRIARAEASRKEDDRLPTQVNVDFLGRGAPAAVTPDVPDYGQLLAWLFRRLEWDAERFDVYRIRMMYPVLPSAVVMRFGLPEKG